MNKIVELTLELCRRDLAAYVERAFAELNPGDRFVFGMHILAISHQLERVLRGEVNRLLITMPPRQLKSHSVSIAFPAFLLGHDPTRRIICASHSADLAQGFSLQCRRLIESPWHRAVFPSLVFDPRKASVEELRTTMNGARIATSVGGSLTGKGGDIIIIDDPLKAEDAHSEAKREAMHAWFTGTVSTRLDDPKTGAIIVVAQRLHEDDLPGRLMQAGGWEILELPAIATSHHEVPMPGGLVWPRAPGELLHPERIDKAQLEQIRREIGSAAFEAQYQQSPVPAGGNLVRLEWFGTIPDGLTPSGYEAIVQSWDTAAVPGQSNDWSVCTIWGLLGNHIDLLDIHRAQHLYPDLLRTARGLQLKWKPRLIVIEYATSGISLFQELREDGLREVDRLSSSQDKVQRLASQSAKIEAGWVRLPQHAPWLTSFQSEVAAFPNGKHDDQVDSMTLALRALDWKPPQLRGISRYAG